ncbi:MAG: ribosome-binding factor [Acidimicrobiaceae bacterium]|nr:ribosome-binding factor [Acidimicrobiaceae bacterium]
MDRRHHRSGAKAYPRTARVNALLQEILAEEIERLADTDDRLALLTLTGVVCEPDLRHATVLLASMPEGSAEALEENRRGLQRSLGGQVRLKRTPALAFTIDPAVTAGLKVEEALRRAAERDAALPPRPEVEPGDETVEAAGIEAEDGGGGESATSER